MKLNIMKKIIIIYIKHIFTICKMFFLKALLYESICAGSPTWQYDTFVLRIITRDLLISVKSIHIIKLSIGHYMTLNVGKLNFQKIFYSNLIFLY